MYCTYICPYTYPATRIRTTPTYVEDIFLLRKKKIYHCSEYVWIYATYHGRILCKYFINGVSKFKKKYDK